MEQSSRDQSIIDSPFFQWIVSNTPIVLFAVDREGVFTLSEGQALESLGLKSGQVVGTSVFDLYSDFPEIIDSIRLSLTGETVSYEADLGDRVFETICSPLENDVGEIIGVVGVATDQTERKQSEKELRHSEEKFRRIFEDASIGMTVTELDGRFYHVNDALGNMLGYSTEELLKMSVSDITHPDDMEKTLEDREKTVTAKTKQGATEKRYLHGDGSVVWGSITRSVIGDTSGNPQYTVAQVTDITQRKKAEEALEISEQRHRDFAKSASDWFWEMGPDLKFTRVSEEYNEVLGIESDFVIGKSRREFANLGEDKEKWDRHEADLKNHRPFRDFCYLAQLTGGRESYISVSGIPIFGKDGTFQGYRGVASDITNITHAEQALQQALNRFHVGVFVLSQSGAVVIKNTEAKHILLERDGLTVTSDGFLRATHTASRAALDAAIQTAITTDCENEYTGKTKLSIRRPSCGGSLLIETLPLQDSKLRLSETMRGGIVFVINPENSLPISMSGMRELYGLTKTESAICKLLVEGYSTNEMAGIRKVKPSTIRDYMKKILSKTHSSRRSDVVRLVLTVNLPIERPMVEHSDDE